MWQPECEPGSVYHVNQVKDLPPGQEELNIWYVYGLDATRILGQVSVFPETKLARITKGLQGGEVVEVILADDESAYPTRLFPKLVLINRGK